MHHLVAYSGRLGLSRAPVHALRLPSCSRSIEYPRRTISRLDSKINRGIDGIPGLTFSTSSRLRQHLLPSASKNPVGASSRKGCSLRSTTFSTSSRDQQNLPQTTYGNQTPAPQALAQNPPQTPPASTLNDLPPYAPPTTGLLSYLPAPLVPYAELIRLDKNVGTLYLFLPCLFSTLLCAPLTDPITSPSTVLSTTFLFLSGALLMRGAGCAVNDFWDRKLDPHVTRTRHRPLARGAITPSAAVKYIIGLHLTAFGVLLQFPPLCLAYGIPSLVLVTLYPLAKRVTYYPQAVLGLTFSWGAIMGFPALGIDLLAPGNEAVLWSAGLLYASNWAWTVLYDMIYAHMDIKDDVKAGIKSIALAHEGNTKTVLTGLAGVQVGLLAAAGVVVGAGPVFYGGVCGSAAVTLGTMIWRVRLGDVGSCWWWFKNGAWFTGGGIAAGLAGEYLVSLMGEKKEGNEEDGEVGVAKVERKELMPAWRWIWEMYVQYRDGGRAV